MMNISWSSKLWQNAHIYNVLHGNTSIFLNIYLQMFQLLHVSDYF